MDKKLEQLKKEYEHIPIPDELDNVVEQALSKRPATKKKRGAQWLLSTAAAAMIFTASVNVSPTLAQSLAQVPMLQPLIDVLTFTEYEMADEHYEANIVVPSITPASEELAAVNEQFAEEGKALYEQFQQDIEAVGEGYVGVKSGYTVYTNTDTLLSMSRYVQTTMASSAMSETFITVDKELKTVVTLPSLFKDARYIEVISSYIKEQMRTEMAKGEATYWIDEAAEALPVDERFTEIDAEEGFYINADNELVIVFNEYDVAPGYMGQVAFTIPTTLIEPLLQSERYIQ